MSFDDELFGDAEQLAVQRRALALWNLVCDDPRFSFYGRYVSVLGDLDESLDWLMSLARVQGVSVAQFFPSTRYQVARARMEGERLKPARWELLYGREVAVKTAQDLVASRTLPQDMTLEEVTIETPAARLEETAALMAGADLMPIPGALMRGRVKPGVMLLARDHFGAVIATATARMIFHDKSHRAKDAFWGLLATREDHRGKGLALYLGAQALVMAIERFGAMGFFAGVAADNEASNALCARLGIGSSDFVGLACSDPEIFSRGSITK
jgi:hypothetical protein